MEFSVHRPSPPNTYSYVLTRKKIGFNKIIRRNLLIVYVYFQPNSCNTSQKLYVRTKMSVMKHIFAPLLLRHKEPPMHKQHCRSLIDTMKSLSPAALTLKPLRRPSNRSSPRQHFIRLYSHIVHVVYCRMWYVCRIERKTDN